MKPLESECNKKCEKEIIKGREEKQLFLFENCLRLSQHSLNQGILIFIILIIMNINIKTT